MRKKTNETHEEWLKRVHLHEYGLALQQLASGMPVEEIMDKMSQRIVNKVTHSMLTDKKSD